MDDPDVGPHSPPPRQKHVVWLTSASAGRDVPPTGPRRVATRTVTLFAVAGMCLAAFAATARSSSSAAVDLEPGVSISEVGRELAAQLDEAGVPGGAVAVAAGGRVKGTGVGSAGGDREVSADTPFVIGSATKSFTALAVMQLVDTGRVDLDASVRRYVPELQLARGEPVEDITVRHLLQQTSGLDDLTGGPLLASASEGSPLAAVTELDAAELASTPGQAWRYANANYVLAGLVVERASGLRYGDYVQREIFAPLGMTSSSATTDSPEADELAEGHRFWFGVPVGTEPVRRDATMAAGYLVSTAADLGRYLSMYLAGGLAPDGTRIVSTAGARTLLDGGPDAVLGPWAQGQHSSYAMGWFVGGPWGDDAVFHPGNTPDTTTMLAVVPDRDVAVAVVVNAGNELPVPGNPFIADRVSRNVVHAALGQRTVDLPSLWRFYAVFDLVVVLLLATSTWALLRAAGSLASRTPPRRRGLSWAAVLLRSLAAGLLALVPALSYGWRSGWTWAPDLALSLGALLVLLVVAAGLRATWLIRGPGITDPPVISTTEGERHHASA